MAIVEGVPVTLGNLEPSLLELAGAEALGEQVIDRRLDALATEHAVGIGHDDLERERALLLTTLDADPDQAVRLLDELRRRQGLGAARFEALLRRNATLRALVRDRVKVNDEAMQITFELLHGERRQPRLIVTATLGEAEEARRRTLAGESFADLALELSTDASASRGGLLAPFSIFDPSYPNAVRQALQDMEKGAISAPVMLEGGFALLRLERIIPADGTSLDQVRAELEELTRRNQERLLMEELVTALVDGASMTILDERLAGAWRARRDG